MSEVKQNYVLYHANCNDGFGAAWAASTVLRNAEYVAVNYGDQLPEIPDGSSIWIVDFSYPRDVLIELSRRTNLIVLDHHKSAAEQLADLDFATFDMNKSGAVITWQHFHSGPTPDLLLYVQDRDLWRWEMPDSREVSAVISVTPKTFDDWDDLAQELQTDIVSVVARGNAILDYQDVVIERQVETATLVRLEGHDGIREFRHDIASVNTQNLISETCHRILTDMNQDIAMCWYRARDGSYRCSLRSTDAIDVSKIARHFGGGGHMKAAGFELAQPPRMV